MRITLLSFVLLASCAPSATQVAQSDNSTTSAPQRENVVRDHVTRVIPGERIPPFEIVLAAAPADAFESVHQAFTAFGLKIAEANKPSRFVRSEWIPSSANVLGGWLPAGNRAQYRYRAHITREGTGSKVHLIVEGDIDDGTPRPPTADEPQKDKEPRNFLPLRECTRWEGQGWGNTYAQCQAALAATLEERERLVRLIRGR